MPIKHTVKPNDTLSKIAKKYGVTVDAIAKANNIKNVNLIYDGDVLTIPDKKSDNTTALVDLIKECISDIQCLKSFKEVMKYID